MFERERIDLFGRVLEKRGKIDSRRGLGFNKIAYPLKSRVN